eukprot:TRINITY_DN6160_c0_g1_i1.p1 TRINITY_DN6160_c0_g1~~TRINITY_DN6160_c0_g1_i1.p1  ORF type:complete len:617 (-),score=100.07 TRINITY_DN6160_c0_g1_i1:92-1942(-)
MQPPRFVAGNAPRARRVVLQPDDWRFAEAAAVRADAEGFLRRFLASETLTQGTCFPVRVGSDAEVFDVYVVECEPEPQVSLAGAAAEVEVLPPRKQRPHPDPAQRLELGAPVVAAARAGECRRYVVTLPEADAGLTLRVHVTPLSGDVNLYVDQHLEHPTLVDCSWYAVNVGQNSVDIAPRDTMRDKKSRDFYVTVHALESSQFTLTVATVKTVAIRTVLPSSCVASSDEHRLCVTCGNMVPRESFGRHSAFCSRNNFRCPTCRATIPNTEKPNHIHCAQCGGRVVDRAHQHCLQCGEVVKEEQKLKHRKLFHTRIACGCGASMELVELRLHKRSQCPLREVSCSFCAKKIAVSSICEHSEKCGNRTCPCDLCGASIAIREMSTHFAQRHRLDEPVRPERQRSVSPPAPEKGTLMACPICQEPCSTFEQLQWHLQATGHISRLRPSNSSSPSLARRLRGSTSTTDLSALLCHSATHPAKLVSIRRTHSPTHPKLGPAQRQPLNSFCSAVRAYVQSPAFQGDRVAPSLERQCSAGLFSWRYSSYSFAQHFALQEYRFLTSRMRVIAVNPSNKEQVIPIAQFTSKEKALQFLQFLSDLEFANGGFDSLAFLSLARALA